MNTELCLKCFNPFSDIILNQIYEREGITVCSCVEPNKKLKVKKPKPLIEFIIIGDDEEYEEEEAPECSGKHCSNTNNLNIGKCWNRYTKSVTDELVCAECWEQDTKIKCVGCWETFTYDKVKLKPQYWPWGSCRENQNFYCQGCIKDITEGVENGRYKNEEEDQIEVSEHITKCIPFIADSAEKRKNKYHMFLMLDLKAYMVRRFQGNVPHYTGNVYEVCWFSPVNFAKYPNYFHYQMQVNYGPRQGQIQILPINRYTDDWIKYQNIPQIQEYYKTKTGQDNPSKKEYDLWGYSRTDKNFETATNFQKMYNTFTGGSNIQTDRCSKSRRVILRTLNYRNTPYKYDSVFNYKNWDKITKKTSLKGLKANTYHTWTEPKREGEEGRARTGGWTFDGFCAYNIELNAIENGFQKVKGKKYNYGHFAEFLMKC